MMQIDVIILPVDPGPAVWNCLLLTPEPVMRVDGKMTADWIVTGAGFAGLAAARSGKINGATTAKGDRHNHD